MEFQELLLAALLVFAATSLGAAGVYLLPKLGRLNQALMLSFCAGIMVFTAVEMISQSSGQIGWQASLGGLLLGGAAFVALEAIIPHLHLAIRKTRMDSASKKTSLLAGTVTLHNVPEGLAIASAFAASPSLGWLVATSMAIQDVPEGLVVSAPFACFGKSCHRSFFWGAFSGFVEAVAAIAGFALLSVVSVATPFALAFSGGAMLCVSFFELMPDAISANRTMSAAFFIAGVAFGFLMASTFGVIY
ncbi:MAG: ZIP family metal transporter [Candidatus Micrarchaeia archaeon]